MATNRMHCAFRGEKDAAISGAGFVVADFADSHPAKPAPPRHHPELSASFPRPWRATKCAVRFPRRAGGAPVGGVTREAEGRRRPAGTPALH